MRFLKNSPAITLDDILVIQDDDTDTLEVNKREEDHEEISIEEAVEAAVREDDGNQYDIISKTAFLIGIKEWVFESEEEPPKMETYIELSSNPNARTIRNLCIIRNQVAHNFPYINSFRQGKNNIVKMTDIIPQETLKELYESGINVYYSKHNPTGYIMHINKLIQTRIDGIRDIFPKWVNWDYLRDTFIMKGGDKEDDIKKEALKFHANMNFYPYRQFINWPASKEGNILKNDRRFLTLLYRWNDDIFADTGLVSDASAATKDNIHLFVEESRKCVFIVDCENSDPYRLCAAIRSLGKERLAKIDKIILFDDVNTVPAWKMLSSYIDIPVEYILIERIKENKSLTDVKLATRACREFYKNDVDSFVLVSSDSDYWGLMEGLPEARFLMMVEHDKCSCQLKGALLSKNIFYCYLDNFYIGGAEDLKRDAINREIARQITRTAVFDLNHAMEEALKKARIEMPKDKMKEFIIDTMADHLRISVNEDGMAELSYMDEWQVFESENDEESISGWEKPCC